MRLNLVHLKPVQILVDIMNLLTFYLITHFVISIEFANDLPYAIIFLYLLLELHFNIFMDLLLVNLPI